MIVILLVLFNVRWRLLPLGIVLIGVIWAFGLAGYLGIPLTLVTISGLPVMLGIGIDYAIQMHARVEEEVIIDHSEHPIQESARNLGPALLVVTFDAIFAFAALRFSKVPMIRSFGLLLAVGVAAICFVLDRGHALRARHPRVPVADQGARLPRGSARTARRVARQRVVEGGAAARDRGADRLRRRRARRGQARDPDGPDRVGQPGRRQAVRNIHEIEQQAGISSELGMYVVSGGRVLGQVREVRRRLHDRAAVPLRRRRPGARALPGGRQGGAGEKRVLANASSIVSIVSFLTEVPGHPAGACRPATR